MQDESMQHGFHFYNIAIIIAASHFLATPLTVCDTITCTVLAVNFYREFYLLVCKEISDCSMFKYTDGFVLIVFQINIRHGWQNWGAINSQYTPYRHTIAMLNRICNFLYIFTKMRYLGGTAGLR